MNQFQSKIEGINDFNLIILSSHDTIITMLLTLFNLQQVESTPFATTLVFELWSVNGKPTVKLFYNGRQLDLSLYCYNQVRDDRSCGFAAFKEKLLDGVHKDIR